MKLPNKSAVNETKLKANTQSKAKSKPVKYNPTISEKAIQTAVIDHWTAFGHAKTLVCAIPNARAFGQPGLTKGLFDLMILSPSDISYGQRTAYIELKRDGRQSEKFGGLSIEQENHRKLLELLRIPHAVCYGRDEPIAQLEAWGIVRKAQSNQWTSVQGANHVHQAG